MKSTLKNILPEFLYQCFTTGAVRSIKVKRSILLSLFVKCSNVAVNFLLVSLSIDYVSPKQYGIWITLSSIVAWFGFFDIGFGNGLRNKLAEAIALGKLKIAKIFVSTTYTVLSLIMLALLIIFFLLNPIINWSAVLNSNGNDRIGTVALIVFICFALQFVLQNITNVMTANLQPALAGSVTLLSNLVTLISVLVLAQTTSGDLVILAIAFSVSPVVVMAIVSILMFTTKYKAFAPSVRYSNVRVSKSLIRLGFNFFIIQISALCLFQTNNIIINQIFGPEEVTVYNIAYKYFGIANMLFLIVLNPFWPAYTDAYYRGDFAWIKQIATKLKLFWLLVLGGILLMTLFSDHFYELWIGKSVTVPFSLSLSCAFYNIVITWSAIFVTFVNGVGKIALQSVFSVVTAIVNIPLAIVMGRQFGLAGLVYANSVCLILGAVPVYLQYRKIVAQSATGIWAK